MAGAGPHISVLIVEDDLVLACETEGVLHDAGYSVCGAAANSTGAIGLVLEKHPDIILMDVSLGRGLDGVDIALTLREAGITAPIVFVTGSTDDVTAGRMERVEGASILFKPVMPRDLEAAMKRAAQPLLSPRPD
jgi:DNA-binding response OmpR family regulator